MNKEGLYVYLMTYYQLQKLQSSSKEWNVYVQLDKNNVDKMASSWNWKRPEKALWFKPYNKQENATERRKTNRDGLEFCD